MIYPIIENLKLGTINHPLVNMTSSGDMSIFDNKLTIKYPYVNFDVVSASIVNYSKKYTIRMYVCDRQRDVTTSYNKTELIVDNLLKSLGQNNYIINYFHNDFQDDVDGVWVDFQYEVPVVGECSVDAIIGGVILTEDSNYIQLENGDLIKTEK